MVPLQLTPLSIAEPLSWVIVIGFLAAAALEYRGDERARPVAVATWFLFGAFWLVLVPHFVFEQKSIVEGIGSIAAVPLSVYAGYLLWNGRDTLFFLTRAVAIMGLIYLPFSYLPLIADNPAREFIIEVTADQTKVLLNAIGVEPELVTGVDVGRPVSENIDYQYESTFYFEGNSRPIVYTIIIACTGLGSMAIFAGAILAVRAPWHRKAKALAVAVPVIYVLNLIRNVFIATMFGEQRMQWFVEPIMTVFATNDPQLVSYYIADRILAQVGSVLALIVITLLIVRFLPEIVILVEDGLRLVTGKEWDLAGAIGVDISDGARRTGLDR
jgi:archaeosortase A (PGF-CTERM-specific)